MRRTQRADMLVDDDGQDPRSPQDLAGDERTMLTGFLRRQRETLEAKCAGLTAEQLATRAVEPSTISLLGLVRHMARVEQGWFAECLDGQMIQGHFRGPDNVDGEWDDAVGTDECVQEAFATWRAECRSSDGIIAGHGLADTFRDNGGWEWNVRSLLGHMIEEYARHLGHADLLRERIDGRLGE
ncbi:MAG: DinB family protein [Janibacter sp.]|nr:DinB family protein [Janibacter sp.]